MAFDNTCKFIAENFSQDIATWLLGQPIALTKMEPSELYVDPIRADAMIFLESEDILLQVEFQTDPDPEMAFRMADYRLRGYRRYPQKQMRQVVVYLRQSQSPRVYETEFSLPKLNHRFQVIRLWEQPPENFLSSPGLLPFAILGKTNQKVEILRAVAQRVDEIKDRPTQANLSAASGILAGLLLDQAIIHQVLRRDIMRESVIYQEIEAEAEARGEMKGKIKGKIEGKIEEGLTLILRQLNRRFGSISPEIQSQVQQLSLEMLEGLSEDLLDFEIEADLSSWLRSRSIAQNSSD